MIIWLQSIEENRPFKTTWGMKKRVKLFLETSLMVAYRVSSTWRR